MEKQDIEILKIIMKKAKERELGASSIIYYYALKHAIEELEVEENRSIADGVRKPFGEYKEFFYSPETKNEDIRKNLIELLSEIDFEEVVPDWNTMEVLFHDYLDGGDPAGPSSIAIRFESTEYKE